MTITVYTTPTCGYCHQVKQFLSQRGVRYMERDVSRDQEAADEMVRRTGQMGVPVIIVDDQIVVGFDRVRLESLIARYTQGERPHLGLSIGDAEKVAQKFGTMPGPGAFIGAVATGLPGATAGLQQGDVITEVNTNPVRNADDLQRIFASLTTGTRLSMTFLRSGERRQTIIII